MQSVIRTENLVKRFRKVEALRGLDIEVPVNSIYALVGPNGAGKTTAIKILMNILQPTSGRAEVLGRPSAELAGGALAPIGYVSENQDLPESMAVGAFLSYLRPFYPTWDPQLEDQLVRRFGLPLERKLRHLSRGMRMKVALTSSLAYRPALIVLDEPFTGLDPLVRDELIQVLASFAGEVTVLVSTHDLAEVEAFATHVGHLESGRLLFSDQLVALSNRFREVEVILDAPAPDRASWPDPWLQIAASDNRVRFIDSDFDPVRTPERIRAEFENVGEVCFTPMSLRSIFIAVARSGAARKSREDA